jgi:hypothetical protein
MKGQLTHERHIQESQSFGRNRQSIADIEQQLHAIFDNHPLSHTNEHSAPVIPASALVDVFRSFSEVYNGVELMTPDEMVLLQQLLDANPGLEVTPHILLQFIAEKTKSSVNIGEPPGPSANVTVDENESPGASSNDSDDPEFVVLGRSGSGRPSRTSSSESIGVFTRTPNSRPSSRAGGASPFDGSKRQRSAPLGSAAPSSWTKPVPAHRRKSDAGSRSDSEVHSFL